MWSFSTLNLPPNYTDRLLLCEEVERGKETGISVFLEGPQLSGKESSGDKYHSVSIKDCQKGKAGVLSLQVSMFMFCGFPCRHQMILCGQKG